ncbi:MAG: intracellular septation protein A [SAR116 cluster bacterium]|nr:intracellular septation protein A [SAR116 cluster bacterium]|tara:strand:+ start:85 stop:678 length:594 start_codon:yes stop_codon:yes gene_type:complete
MAVENKKDKIKSDVPVQKEGYKSLLEMGPLILFFVVNYFYGIFAGTAILVVSTIISLIVSKLLYKSIPMLAAFGCVAVVLFGSLTLIFDNDLFIKIKPTVVSLIIAGILLLGKVMGKNPLALVMQSSITLEEEGWTKLTWLWVFMFIVMAIANEIAWRNLTTDQWVSFKAFGIPVLSVFFGLLSLPILKKYQIEKKI